MISRERDGRPIDFVSPAFAGFTFIDYYFQIHYSNFFFICACHFCNSATKEELILG